MQMITFSCFGFCVGGGDIGGVGEFEVPREADETQVKVKCRCEQV